MAVIGAGSSGLAVLKALREHGVGVEGFERGSDVGGLWRYENDNGLSGAYASLHTNASRLRMQYPSFPMPESTDGFPHHSEMAAYLDAYAEAFGLRELIRFGSTVEGLEPTADARWSVTLDDGLRRTYRAVVVATGVFWSPRVPTAPGSFDGEVSHAHDYRLPAPFAGRRVLIVGAGPSAGEIAVEISTVAERTFMSVRRGAHVIPRWLGRKPFDAGDVEPLNRLPWRLLNRNYRRSVTEEIGPPPATWPSPGHRVLEGIPIISSDLFPAVRRGDVVVKPAIERLRGDCVSFVDGSQERVDHIVYATGYEISLPFLSSSLLAADGRRLPLYRRIVAPEVGGLFFAGFVDTPGGLLPVVETQAEWIAAVLIGGLRLPPPEKMWRAIERAERRTRQRFPDESPLSIRCDPHAYRRLLESDLRRVRRAVRRAGKVTATTDKATWRDAALGVGRELDLSQGRLLYFEAGSGAPIVFVHGLLANANLWRKVVAKLSPEFRCLTLDLPLGSHTLPMPDDADLTPHGVAELIADALEALALQEVTLVGNDIGGAVCQMVVTRRPARIGRLVLTSCDYRDNFPPPMFGYFKPAAAVPGAMRLLMLPMRLRLPRRLPFALGWLVKRPIDGEAEDSYLLPGMVIDGVERDLKRVIKGLDTRYTNEAADRLGEFDKPALIAWSREDHFFKPAHARRLAHDLPDARLEWIENARSLSPEDEPDRLADLIATFVREPAPAMAPTQVGEARGS